MSITRYLLQVLPRPVYYSVDQLAAQTAEPGIYEFLGVRHETLAEARDIVRQYGFEILDFPLIIAVLRNPYAIEVSRYKYTQQNYDGSLSELKELSMNEDFGTFVFKSSYHAGGQRPLHSYFLLDGKTPPNLKILRQENLVQDLNGALCGIGIEPVADLPHENQSFHSDYRLYYTRASEEIVYKKYRWAFDAGWYQRFDPGGRTRVQVLEHELKDLKLGLGADKQEIRRLNEKYRELEYWARELEARLIKQEGFIHKLRRLMSHEDKRTTRETHLSK